MVLSFLNSPPSYTTMVNPTQNCNRAIDEAISQLRIDSTNHTTSLDSMRSDISNLKTAINHIIQSVSEIATKLGCQITLPPPLLLSSAPPTAALDPHLNSSLVSKVSTGTSSAVTTLDSELIPNLLRLTSILIPSKTAILKTATNTPTITPSTISGITGIKSFLDNPVVKARSEIASHIQLDTFSLGVMLLEGLCVQTALKSSLCKEQEWSIAHNMFAEMYKLKQGSKVFIFDPGGTFHIEGISDLEDKVVFKRSGMILLEESRNKMSTF